MVWDRLSLTLTLNQTLTLKQTPACPETKAVLRWDREPLAHTESPPHVCFWSDRQATVFRVRVRVSVRLPFSGLG